MQILLFPSLGLYGQRPRPLKGTSDAEGIRVLPRMASYFLFKFSACPHSCAYFPSYEDST